MRRKITVSLAIAAVLSIGCGPKDLINKTKYGGKTYKNTCQTFKKEVQATLDANSDPTSLHVSEYDNSQFAPEFVEPGQFIQANDTLYFRLANDLEYPKYLQKNVAIIVRVDYSTPSHLANMETDAQGTVGEVIITESYYKANSQPFFVYKVPLGGKRLDGKQVSLYFSVVKMEKGKITKVYCDSRNKPFGPADPSCCTTQPWAKIRTGVRAALPDLPIRDEQYRYEGFEGTLDLIFPIMSAKFNRKELTDAILQYVNKYEQMGFLVQSIKIDGYASPDGRLELNQNLSQKRMDAVAADLQEYFVKKVGRDIPVEGTGRGEDWQRFDILVKTADFSDQERAEILRISSQPIHEDDREKELRKLPYWGKIKEKVLPFCRHALVGFTFTYQPDKMYVERYNAPMPLMAPELYNVATKTFIISRFRSGVDARQNLGILNTLIDTRGNRTANLLAMRSTYHFALNDIKSAVRDIESAASLDKGNPVYNIAALAYRTQNVFDMSREEAMQLLERYNDLINRAPNDRSLYINRAIVMDHVGWLSGAIADNTKVISQDGRLAVAYNNRGVSLMKAMRLLEAEADFLQASSLDPNLAEAHYNLAVLYAYKGYPEKSAQAMEKAIRLRPDLRAELNNNPVFKVVRDHPRFGRFSN
ncbi:MAG: tetratricopeptide repeat protein [Bacteroidia bacterium]|nr:tetratricopeptide repeat protein [Bacteroidia bacterium]MCX7652569.1 tetratricopeptide repeat protein [Bacteroidia bacterium]MDW8417555.1 tetratricopeptide repeat protein [Bacteroidia bacterium]